MDVKVEMLIVVVDKLVRVLQAAESLLDEVRFEVIRAVQGDGDERAVGVRNNVVAIDEPPALGVPLCHRVALPDSGPVCHCGGMWSSGRWKRKDEDRVVPPEGLVGAARRTIGCPEGRRRCQYERLAVEYWNNDPLIVVARGSEGDCDGAFASGEETRRQAARDVSDQRSVYVPATLG